MSNFHKPPFTITSKILTLVSDISEVVTKLELSEQYAITPALRKANKIKTITGTLEIEDNSLGIKKVTAIFEGKRVLGSVKEIAEVRGAIKVYENLEIFDYKKIDDILKAHKLLMGDILTHAGKFRTKDVVVGGKEGVIHIAPPSNRVPILMDNLFEWLRISDIHPLIKSSVFHYEFEFIHPFIDGNGRVGRLWQALILYHWKDTFSMIPVESVVKDTGENYYEALQDSGTLGESTPFIEFMLKAILLASKRVLKESQNVPLNVPKDVPLKRLEYIIKLIKQNGSVTTEQIARKCNVSAKTIKRDIAKLKESGKLERIGSLKNGHWEITKIG